VTPLGKLFRTTAFKISLGYLVIFAIGAGLVLSRVGWHVKELIDEQIKQTIDTDITGLAEQYAEGGIRQLTSVIDRRVKQPGAGLYLVTTYTGEPITGNITSLPAGVLSRAGTVETTYQKPGEPAAHNRAFARIFILPDGFRLLVGHDIEEEERLRQILSGALVASLVWLTIIGTLGGLLVARRLLTRVDAINAGARRIVEGDLTGRMPVTGSGDELDRLVLNLNGMLDRICDLMGGLKEVSDNIAHDLRTPLTRLRNGAEEALRSATTLEDNHAALEKVIEESDTMIRIFDALLMIARAEAGASPEGMNAFDVAAVVEDVGELYEPLAEDRGVRLKTSAQPGLMVEGSRELIGQALANLIDNALKYGTAGHSVKASGAETADICIAAERHAASIEIFVADHGPGIPISDRKRVLDRFVRLENSRSRPGSGLGLSLAAAVARLHGGTLRVEGNDPGLKVVLSLPPAPAATLPAPLTALTGPPNLAGSPNLAGQQGAE
jgi:signal transduction histidine kinase